MTIRIQPGKYYRLKGGGVMHDRFLIVANTASHSDENYQQHNQPFSRTWLWTTDGLFQAWEYDQNYPMHVEREILE